MSVFLPGAAWVILSKTPKADESIDQMRECDSDKGEGGPRIRKFCGHHLSMAPKVTKACLQYHPPTPMYREIRFKCDVLIVTLLKWMGKITQIMSET